MRRKDYHHMIINNLLISMFSCGEVCMKSFFYCRLLLAFAIFTTFSNLGIAGDRILLNFSEDAKSDFIQSKVLKAEDFDVSLYSWTLN